MSQLERHQPSVIKEVDEHDNDEIEDNNNNNRRQRQPTAKFNTQKDDHLK